MIPEDRNTLNPEIEIPDKAQTSTDVPVVFARCRTAVVRLSQGVSWISFFGLLVMVCMTVADILLRLAINYTIPGVIDWICFLMVPVGFCSLAYSTYRGEQVLVTILTDHMPKTIVFVLDLLNYLFTLMLVFIIIWKNFDQAAVVRKLGIKVTNFPIETFWFYYVIIFGYSVLFLIIIVMMIERVLKGRDEK